jgi:hypothetical protein
LAGIRKTYNKIQFIRSHCGFYFYNLVTPRLLLKMQQESLFPDLDDAQLAAAMQQLQPLSSRPTL